MKKLKGELYDEGDIESGSDLGSDDDDEICHEAAQDCENGATKRLKLLKRDSKRMKLNSTKYTKQPTVEELNKLRETENLFNSNFFRLQIDEIISEVRVKPKYLAQFNKWFVRFSKFILELKDEDTATDISHRTWLSENNIEFPIVESPVETKARFRFIRCPSVGVVGSHSYGTCLAPGLSVDIKANIPKEFFDKNDNINERYHRKKALYMCYIAAKLKQTELVKSSQFRLLDGCNLKPVLLLKPEGEISRHVTVVFHFGIESNGMKCVKFLPFKSNVRENWRLGKEGEGAGEESNLATPLYNSTVASDLTSEENHKFLVQSIANSVNIQQGIILLKIWLKQRNFTQFSGHILTMFLAYLVKIKRINNSMSSYQVIRNVWTALGSSEWDKKGITLADMDQTPNRPSIFEFHNHFPVVFVDCSGFYNICSHVSMQTYQQIRQESLLAVTYLDDQSISGFSSLFMIPLHFNLVYDHIIRIENTPSLRNTVIKSMSHEELVDCGPDMYCATEKCLLKVLSRGLGDRVTTLAPQGLTHGDVTWPCEVPPAAHYNKPYFIGIKLHPDNASRSVDKGPQANLPEAEEFRSFWGAKSELRRFQDGSICEACVWQTSPTAESRRSIVKQVVSYLLETKLGLEDKLFYVSDQFDVFLHNCKYQPTSFKYGTGEEAASRVNLALDSLMKDLRTLQDTPLEIHSIHGVSPVFSFTDVCPPLPYSPVSTAGFTNHQQYRTIRDYVKERKKNKERVELCAPAYLPTLPVVVQLSQSGKWPDDLEAFRRVKTAFYLQIAKALKDQFQLMAHPWQDCLHVMKNHYVFRVEIAHPKEINLAKKLVDKDNVTRFQDTEESIGLEYKLMHLPRLRIALNGLQHEYPCYGPSTCLLKRWFRSHLLDAFHFPDVCIDILMAHIFMQPAPYQVSMCPQTAFWRALALLGTTDWSTQMIVLNFNDDITREQLTSIEKEFNSNRSSLPPLYIVTPYESRKPSVWSREAPTYQILARVQMLATQALQFVDQIIFKESSNDVKALFSPNLEGSHVLIHLKSVMNPMSYLQINSGRSYLPNNKLKNQQEVDEMFPVLDFDPVQIYLSHLRSSYGEFALFFHDTYGGDVISVLWKPAAVEAKELKTSLLNGRKWVTVKGKSCLTADIDGILDGFIILGDGLVQSIEIKHTPDNLQC